MSFKTIKGNIKQTLNGFQVSGKSIQYHSAEFGHSAPPPSGHTATGGVINDYSDGGSVYRTHIFTSTGTFNVTALGTYGNTVDFLVVGGGGGGGGAYEAGGGGAGGYRTSAPEGPGGPSPSAETALTISTSPGSYTVTIGAGGNGGGDQQDAAASIGNGGGVSTFSTITSQGGGGGGTYTSNPPHANSPGRPGGSGGGAANQHPTGPGSGGDANKETGTSTPAPNQGYRGGNRGLLMVQYIMVLVVVVLVQQVLTRMTTHYLDHLVVMERELV